MRALTEALFTMLGRLAPAFAIVLFAPLAFAQDDDWDDMQFEPDEIDSRQAQPPEDTSPPSATLERGTSLYDEGRYYPASIEFHKVISGETDDSEANRHRAEFFLGKTLYHLGFYAGSMAYFERIVELGYGHKYFPAALPWLAALSRVLPESSGILNKIGAYDPSDLEDPIMSEVRDELFYLLGRHFYQQGQFEQAVDLFQRVSRDDPFFLRAKFFEAVTHVRQYEGQPAVEAFQDLLIINEEMPSTYERGQIRRFAELARLQLARVFYSTQQYDTAIRYYEQLPQDSPDWLDGLFEASWAYFMRGENSKALGNIHTLTAPYFEDQFYPESVILKSVIFYNYCLYDRALEAVEEFNEVYRPYREEIERLLQTYQDDVELYGLVMQVQNGSSPLADDVARLVRNAVADRTAQNTFRWVENVDRELELLNKAEEGWRSTSVAGDVLEALTLIDSFARADAGGMARERLERLEDQLREYSRDALKVRIEVLNALAGDISAEARGQQISGDHEPEPIDVDDEHVLWNFNGEYWKDELGFYRYKIRSQCAGAGRLQ
jgi:tetratricopeptide (TPR) repeat protein